MNEKLILRIQQLAEEADNFTIKHFNTALKFPDPKEWQCIRDVKFAELIAFECANIAMSHHVSSSFESYDEFDRGCDDTASFISSHIRTYFGKVMDNFNFDLERMNAAVESKRIPIPPEALTSEEAFDKWLNEDNDEPTN